MTKPQRILIGGSSGTGSSLLKNLLSRHSRIFAGSETWLFTKKELYENFIRFKYRIPFRFPLGLKSHSYHLYNGMDLVHAEFGWNWKEIKGILKNARDFPQFVDSYFERPLERYDNDIWIEKTPANAFLFKEFLDGFPGGKVIMMVRNPYQTIYSLISRNFGLLRSTATYLLNTSACLRVIGEDNLLICKYEDLTEFPERTLSRICSFLQIEYEEQMLEPTNPYRLKVTRLPSWRYDEMSEVGRIERTIADEVLGSIHSSLRALQVSDAGQRCFGLTQRNITKIMKILNYPEREIEAPDLSGLLQNQVIKDRFSRILRGYNSGFQYPVELRKPGSDAKKLAV